MKQYLIEFRAEYYCQGYEWCSFTRLVYGFTYKDACDRLAIIKSDDWLSGSPKEFKNLTIE